MKSINLLYEGNESITRFIDNGELHCDTPYFVRIVTASEEAEKAVEIARFVKSNFPNATIMGFSASGIIFNGEQHVEGTLILFKLLERTQVFQTCFNWENKSAAQVAAEVADAIADKPARLMHVVCSDYYYDMHDFVEEFNSRNKRTAMVGGLAGGINSCNGPNGYVFTHEGVFEKSIIISALCGGEFNFYNGVNTAHEPVSGKHKVTKAEDGILKEINGQEVRQWLFEQLGLEKLESYNDWEVMCGNDMLVHFPLILESCSQASRFLRYDSDRDGITPYHIRIPQGTEFRIGYVDPNECLQESFRLCNEVMNTPIEDLFCYTCLFRRLYLENCSAWELSPYKSLALCGAFMMGEISYINGRNQVLNGSCCLVGVAENEAYIRPNIHAFEELSAIGNDTTNLLNIVLKRQQEATTRQNEVLIQTLITQQQTQEKHIFIDFNTGMPNYLKYKEDLKTNRFDKLCVIKVENAELLTTHLGHGSYLEIIKDILGKGKEALVKMRKEENALMELYVFNDSTFFIASDERMSQGHFMRFCEEAHKLNHIYHVDDNVVVSRFVVCLAQSSPIESALNALAANKNNQTSFLICDEEDSGTSTDEEFKMIGVLNRAFEKDGVVPYFQGIHNNKEQRISYYEALVRIHDIDGTTYGPGQFIGVAKKYRMYSTLSNIMLTKVFDLFENTNETVSLNISAFDIQSDTTKELVFNKLKASKHPENFVFEILEDEAYQDFTPLKEFISNVRALGARVAIDDFGAGYSNLYEISSISFDIIKVDGSIIRNLPSNKYNRKLLDVITHMGVLFKADIVAEFVENQEIQEIVYKTGIKYSQGYLFAKPMPFEKLTIAR